MNPLLTNDTTSTQEQSKGISEFYDGVYFGDSIDDGDDGDIDHNNGQFCENDNHLHKCCGGEYQKEDKPMTHTLPSDEDNTVTSSSIEYEGVDYSDSDLDIFCLSKIGPHQIKHQGLQSTQHDSDNTNNLLNTISSNLVLTSLQEEE